LAQDLPVCVYMYMRISKENRLILSSKLYLRLHPEIEARERCGIYEF